jgi:outer membrane receptor protein involved in Fe transport
MRAWKRLVIVGWVGIGFGGIVGAARTATIKPAEATTQPTTAPATEPAAQEARAEGTQGSTGQLNKIVVTSDLDRARDQIAPSLGADSYTIGPDQIQAIPQGENAPFQQLLLRMPGVVEDSFGQEHVRGEHGNLTYRVNGVILPEPLNGFGQELDSHLVDTVTLIDGTLPAQFGFRTAGIIDVTTKSGASLQNNEISMYGGSYDTYHPSFEAGGAEDKWDYFVTGSYLHNSLGIENPTSSKTPIHDDTDQFRLFSYTSYHIDDTSRLSFLLNGSYANFQIPNTPNQPPAFSLQGVAPTNSSEINENQNEQNYYGVVSYQKSADTVSLQASGFMSYGQIHFTPDPTLDLIYQGVSGSVLNDFLTEGVQVDSSWIVNDQNTFRAGLIGDYTVEMLGTNTSVFPIDVNTGSQSSNVPSTIVDDTKNHALSAGIYFQDEWRMNSYLTLNYGLRYDQFNANFDREGQVSPRINMVWKVNDATTAHFGYARYFVPPPVQFIPGSSIAKFVGTTNAPANLQDDPPRVERSNYFDMGVSRQITEPWMVNVDGFFKQAHNLVDLGQFGDAVILSPYNYHTGYDFGAELSTTYKQNGFSAFGNFAWVETGGRDINSQQFQNDPDELAYIQSHFIKLDHESEYTVSLGASYDLTKNDLVYADMLYGSGLRAGFANLEKEPEYNPVNVGYQHTFHTGHRGDTVRFRFDVINMFDEIYQLRNGTGIGVAAPQYGQRRTFLVGLAYDF